MPVSQVAGLKSRDYRFDTSSLSSSLLLCVSLTLLSKRRTTTPSVVRMNMMII